MCCRLRARARHRLTVLHCPHGLPPGLDGPACPPTPSPDSPFPIRRRPPRIAPLSCPLAARPVSRARSVHALPPERPAPASQVGRTLYVYTQRTPHAPFGGSWTNWYERLGAVRRRTVFSLTDQEKPCNAHFGKMEAFSWKIRISIHKKRFLYYHQSILRSPIKLSVHPWAEAFTRGWKRFFNVLPPQTKACPTQELRDHKHRQVARLDSWHGGPLPRVSLHLQRVGSLARRRRRKGDLAPSNRSARCPQPNALFISQEVYHE